MTRASIPCGAILAGLAVAAGAFGAHGLAPLLEATGRAGNWETACRYALDHGLAMVAVGLLAGLRPQAAPRRLAAAGWCFLVGTLLFSGCLGALALSGVRVLGAIVPIGGVLFLAGWGLFASAAVAAARR